jgi:uncharacterized protein YcnI
MLFVRRAAASATLVTIATLAFDSTTFAHIDPDPEEAPAGSEQSVGFTVEHGCDGSPTTRLDMRLPEGVSSAVAEPLAGWTGSVDANVVTYTADTPLPDDVEATFRVSMILPLTPDATIYFPFVQRCEIGEIRWIDIPQDGSDEELAEPAPAMLLTAPLPGTTEPPAPTTTASPATTVGTPAQPTTTSPTDAPSTTSEPAVPAESTAVGSTDPTTVATSSSDDDRGSSGTVVFIGVILAVAIVGGLAARQARRRR